MTSSTKADGYANLQGLRRDMDILELVADQALNGTQIANALRLTKGTTHRTLAYLRERGYVRRADNTDKYSIGSRLYHIGMSHAAKIPLVHAARGYLRAAAYDTSSTAQIVTRYGRRSVNLLIADSRHEPIASTTVAFHFPLHCGSKGQVLLAFEPAESLEEYLSRPLERMTRHTITDPQELRERLAQIREEDVSVTNRDIQLSSGSVAAPIRDASGRVVASITLIVPSSDVQAMTPKLKDSVLEAARSISIAVGWRPDTHRNPSS